MLPPDTKQDWSFLNDEGYAHLLPNPPTLKEMKAHFIAQRDRLEIQLAAEAARRRQTTSE